MPVLRKEPFSHPDWLFELKWDGFRALAFIERGECCLVSKNGNAFKSFLSLTRAAPEGSPREVRHPRRRDRVPRQEREEPVHRPYVPSRRAEVLRVRYSPVRWPGPTVPSARGPEAKAKDGDATLRREAPLHRSPRAGRRDLVLIRADDGHGRDRCEAEA
jgi:hypothetical protein